MLEYPAEQMDGLLAELEATRDGIRETREIMQCCISKSEEFRAVIQEGLCYCRSLIATYSNERG